MTAAGEDRFRGYRGPCRALMEKLDVPVWSEVTLETTEGEFLVDGRLGVDELGEMMGVELPNGDWDTVGGLLLSLAGRVPEEGESFVYEKHVFVADKVQGRRISRVRMRSS